MRRIDTDRESSGSVSGGCGTRFGSCEILNGPPGTPEMRSRVEVYVPGRACAGPLENGIRCRSSKLFQKISVLCRNGLMEGQ